MCGIAGIINLKETDSPARSELESMIHAVHHRGPDGYGFFENARFGLAHARLSIIDLEGGDQPIHNESGSVQVVFNGEIFNYLELRKELKHKGHQFYTHSDTEVIVHLYEEYGEHFVDYLNGQFAIALVDLSKNKTILVRDRVGIRPLFYTQIKNRLYFASEVKSLLSHKAISTEINPQYLAEVFTFWSALEPNTIYKDIHVLPAGHMMTIQDAEVKISRYWDWSFSPDRINNDRSLDDWTEELRALLVDSVRLQLRSDVPVGAYLSGGLDSSVTTSLIKNYTDTPLRTFSVGFEDNEFDESKYQNELIDYLQTEHTHRLCQNSEIGENFPRVVWHAETALLRTAATPMMMLSNEVRKADYKVVLTGEGADEIFGGYDLFKEAKVRRFWSHEPDSSWRPKILNRLYPYLKHSPTSSGAFTQNFFKEGLDSIAEPYFAHLPRWKTSQRAFRFFSQTNRAELNEEHIIRRIEKQLPEGIKEWKPLNRDQYIEAHTLLSGYLLCSQGDRVAMANSIEARFPFLDHRVIEFAATLPVRYKIMGLNEKYILKKAMSGLIPQSILQRSKQPYRSPDNESFFKNGKPLEYVDYLMSPERIKETGLFDPKAVNMLVNKCAKGRVKGFAENQAFVGMLSSMLVDETLIKSRSISP